MGDDHMVNFCVICGKELPGRKLICDECEHKVLFQLGCMDPKSFMRQIDHSVHNRKEGKEHDRKER